MADLKISQLTAGNPAQTGDEIPIARSGANFKITAGSISALPPTTAGANQVIYVNSAGTSLVGAAGFTFDGTNVTTTGTSSATKLIPTGGTVAGNGMYLPAANTVAISTNGTDAIRADSSQNVFIGNTTTNTNSSKAVVNGTISETVSSVQYLVASQYDVGSAPNQIPLNQYLGTMAFQDSSGVNLPADALISTLRVGLGGGAVATNTAFGVSALNANTTGAGNVAIGRNALLVNTIGTDNVAIGHLALDANTTGVGNVGVGTNALGANTIGTNNVAVGLNALRDNTTGVNNTAVGGSSLRENTIGFQNTAVGSSALLVNTTGTDNVAVGFQALDANTTGVNNIGIGTNALGANTIGTNSIAIGPSALSASTTGDSNIAIGTNALQLNTTGNDNVAIGRGALRDNTIGVQNVAVGRGALLANTIGVNNIAVGFQALVANTTGNNNVAVGVAALGANTTGVDNIALGSSCLDANTTGVNNIGIGTNALGANTTGVQNIAVGSNTLLVNTIGTDNVAIGIFALDANTTGVSNVGIGTNALGANTTGVNNVAVGLQAGDTITTGTGNTIVGHDADSGSATAANRIVLGRAVTGTANARITIGNGTNIAELDLDGADTTWAASSDARLKENVQESAIGLALINDLRVVNFQWRRKRDIDPALSQYEDSDERVHGEGDKAYLGFIAQEAQAALEAHNADTVRLVRPREDGILTTAPAALVPVLVKAVQELAKRIEQLENNA